jgi:hypothetical protein
MIVSALLSFGACTSNPTPHPGSHDTWGGTNRADVELTSDFEDHDGMDTTGPEAPMGAGDADKGSDSDDVDSPYYAHDGEADAEDAGDPEDVEAGAGSDDQSEADHYGAGAAPLPPPYQRVEDGDDSGDDD